VSDWIGLRDYLREDLQAQLDQVILHDPDPSARALLAANRERVLCFLVDQVELLTLRRITAEREQAVERSEREPGPSIIKLNGHTSAKRCVKV
jgi:hypothetical protein